MGTRSIYRELGQHHAPLVRPLGEASRRAEPEPASGRASKLWLEPAIVVDICYYGYGEPLGSAGEGHTGFRRDLARSCSPYGEQGGKRVNPFPTLMPDPLRGDQGLRSLLYALASQYVIVT